MTPLTIQPRSPRTGSGLEVMTTRYCMSLQVRLGLASKARAQIPAAIGALADVPKNNTQHSNLNSSLPSQVNLKYFKMEGKKWWNLCVRLCTSDQGGDEHPGHKWLHFCLKMDLLSCKLWPKSMHIPPNTRASIWEKIKYTVHAWSLQIISLQVTDPWIYSNIYRPMIEQWNIPCVKKEKDNPDRKNVGKIMWEIIGCFSKWQSNDDTWVITRAKTR